MWQTLCSNTLLSLAHSSAYQQSGEQRPWTLTFTEHEDPLILLTSHNGQYLVHASTWQYLDYPWKSVKCSQRHNGGRGHKVSTPCCAQGTQKLFLLVILSLAVQTRRQCSCFSSTEVPRLQLSVSGATGHQGSNPWEPSPLATHTSLYSPLIYNWLRTKFPLFWGRHAGLL